MPDSPSDHTLALLRRLDAKLDRLQARLDDHTGRLQRLEQRYGRAVMPPRSGGGAAIVGDGLNAAAASASPHAPPAPLRDHDVLVRLDEIERRLRRLEDGIY